MTPEQAQFLASLPLQVLLLLALYKVYTDGRVDRAQILDELKQARKENEAMNARLDRIEYHLGIDGPPASPVKYRDTP